jgi:N-acyl-D-amino-acid deacylase
MGRHVLAIEASLQHIARFQKAVQKLSNVAAHSLNISKRGELKVGNFADILVFDPAKVKDNATFEKPHQYATGMVHVLVNGVQVLKNGEHTNAKPGRFVKGAGANTK